VDLSQFTTIGGAVVVVAILVEVIKRAWNPDGNTAARFLPLISIAVGIAVVFVAMFGLGLLGAANVVEAIFTGIFAGAAASGVYDTVTGPTKTG
jgi:hypothetical protein